MDIIQLLPDHIANQIAAGEVIQRPASAVKEMLENALDSGANNIKLFIKDAGKTLIQVVDNGCGMSETDARMSFERHATSKIRNADDLFNIQTMGFRGEAMASMAAIAHVEVSTKQTEEELGSKIIIEGSKIKSQENCICANGTSVKIKNLFFNVPARRNFLKSDKVETRHIIDQFIRISLANPEISWSLFLDDNEYFHLENSNFRQRIVNIIGSRTNEKLVPVEEETHLVKIDGFIGKPEFAKRSRGEQYFFVNGRFIKNHYLNHAVSKAFTDLIVEGYHPSYFLNLKIDPKKIDINIHPTKTEIKFEDEQAIYAILRSAVKRALGKYNIAPTLDFNTEAAFNLPLGMENTEIKEPKIRVNTNYNPFDNKDSEKIEISNQIYQNSFDTEIQTEIKLDDIEVGNKQFFQIENNFIAAQSPEGLIIIHQQRAHQRILYEYFKNNEGRKLNSQKLLFSQSIHLNKIEMENIKEIEVDLNNIGFEFDANTESLEITAVPTECINENLQELFYSFINNNELESSNLKEKLNTKISKVLSRSLSVKSGQKMSEEEMKQLVNELMKCDIPSISPYGLSTYFNITSTEINKKFN